MSDKLMRDELLRSHRYQSLSSDTAKLLFIHLFLSTDHFSNVEVNSTIISIIMKRDFSDDACATLLTELSDKDLLRLYTADGKTYAHFPRARQRLRFQHGKFPRPPANIEDNEINEFAAKVSRESDGRLSEVEGEGNALPKPKRAPVDKSVNKWWASAETMAKKGAEFGLTSPPGESRDAFYQRIRIAILKSKKKEPQS